jgi:hypothetical protein
VRPVRDTTILIPSFEENCGFQSVTIKQSGTVEYSENGTCMHAAVPVMYVGDSQSSLSGDMDLDPPVCVSENILAYRTRPFPDGREASLVLLSGSAEVAESGELGTLPPNYRPYEPVVAVCSLDGDYVTITPGGEVLVTIQEEGPKKISLDNVRFTTRDVDVVRARFPYRSSIHAFSIASGQLKLSPAVCDLFVPVTVVQDSKPFLTVLGYLESGHVVPLYEDEETEFGHFFISSLLLSPACADILTPLGVCAMEDLKDDMGAICGKNLSTWAYADLVQDEYLKWARRDREWRQLGYRPNRNIDK